MEIADLLLVISRLLLSNICSSTIRDVISCFEAVKPSCREAKINTWMQFSHKLVSLSSEPVMLHFQTLLAQRFKLFNEFLLHVRPECSTATPFNSLAAFLAHLNFILSFNPPMQAWFGDLEILAGFVFIAAIFVVKLKNLKFPLPGVRMSLAS